MLVLGLLFLPPFATSLLSNTFQNVSQTGAFMLPKTIARQQETPSKGLYTC